MEKPEPLVTFTPDQEAALWAKVEAAAERLDTLEFAAQAEEARKQGEERFDRGPIAIEVHYVSRSRSIVIRLRGGYSLVIPVRLLQGIDAVDEIQLRDVRVSGAGFEIEFTTLDLHFGVEGLLAGVFGSKSWMAHLGAKGGRTRTIRKAEAARTNGKKGGRPKKIST